MTGREHPGLCDARTAVAFHPAPRPRWLTPGSILRRRLVCQLATEPELIMVRDFVNTSPFYVHESRPAPLQAALHHSYGTTTGPNWPADEHTLPACGTDACRQGRGAPCGTGCAEVISAQADGARMAMGDQAPSEPMPLVILRRHLTDQEVGEAWGNVIGWPLGVLAVVATVAAVAAALR